MNKKYPLGHCQTCGGYFEHRDYCEFNPNNISEHKLTSVLNSAMDKQAIRCSFGGMFGVPWCNQPAIGYEGRDEWLRLSDPKCEKHWDTKRCGSRLTALLERRAQRLGPVDEILAATKEFEDELTEPIFNAIRAVRAKYATGWIE